MKFVHIADMHFDSPFVNLSEKDILGNLRRLDQRKAFKEIIEYIKENDINYFFVSGDLYEHKYVKQSTIEYINNLFKEIPNTYIFISPGNHDPNTKNSYYNKFNWNDNVKIFTSKIEKIETEDANIYGYGFDDFYCSDSMVQDIILNEEDKPNILVIHGNLDGTTIEDMQYNSMSKKMLQEKGFDYVALGHIHKKDYNTEENQKIVYPGSTIALGFDELGEHGMIVGELKNKELKTEFIQLDNKQFTKRELNVDNIYSKEELIENINDINFLENEYLEIILIGNRNFEINKYDLIKYIENKNIIKIKDSTKIGYDLEKLQNETTLKGLFIKEMNERLKKASTKEEKEIIEKSIEIGLEALE